VPAALSVDLRERVVAAIAAGSSCRRAAERFGVGAASAIRWYARFRQSGQLAPKPTGGDRASHRVEAHAALILQTCEARPQIFLRELCDSLREHGIQTSTSGLSRFFARHGITWKKGLRTQPSRSDPT
jgi:transposase